MKKQLTKLLAVMLVFVLALGAFAVPAFAAEEDEFVVVEFYAQIDDISFDVGNIYPVDNVSAPTFEEYAAAIASDYELFKSLTLEDYLEMMGSTIDVSMLIEFLGLPADASDEEIINAVFSFAYPNLGGSPLNMTEEEYIHQELLVLYNMYFYDWQPLDELVEIEGYTVEDYFNELLDSGYFGVSGYYMDVYDYTVEIPENYLKENSIFLTIDDAYVSSVEVDGVPVEFEYEDLVDLGWVCGTAEVKLTDLEDGDIITVTSHFDGDEKTYTFRVAATEADYFAGDVNKDGRVTIADVTEIQRHLAHISEFDAEELDLADYNFDNKVDINDATDIQKFLAKIY
ncbi:MAG: dockerin type I repeat-containing protein [Oscillospiraceae bacterium]|jgi:hypothetical protein|nr:dockerin type I repeat-containing protein [Oscillospiraceae bacterium]